MGEKTQREGNYFALGAIVGAALGVAGALLLAPQPGDRTRAVLKEKGIELQHRVRKAAPHVPEPRIEIYHEEVSATAEGTAEGSEQG